MKKIPVLLGLFMVLAGVIFAGKADIDEILKRIHWLHHASFMIEYSGKTIYIDPYEIKGVKPADYIFITHNHPDHLSLADIRKITHKNTLIICTQESAEKLKAYNLKIVKPGDVFDAGRFKCGAVPAYNNKKAFHPKKDGNAGYIIALGGIRIYHAGDTDYIHEMNVMESIDIAIVPVGGFYTMGVDEAAKVIRAIKPKIAVPMHFNYRIGKKNDGQLFAKAASAYARVMILNEEEPK